MWTDEQLEERSGHMVDILLGLRIYYDNINDATMHDWAKDLAKSEFSVPLLIDAAREVKNTVKASQLKPAHLFDCARTIRAYDARKRLIEHAERKRMALPESTDADPVMPAAAWEVRGWVREQTVRGDDGALHAPSDAQVQAKFREVVARMRKEGILEGPTSVREFLSGLKK